MTLTTHAIVGAAVVSIMPQHPLLGLCAAFASHFLIDAIPHWDYPLRSASVDPKIGAPMRWDGALVRDALVIGADALLGIILSILFFATPATLLLILAGALAGILPDPLQFIYAHLRREPLISLQRFHEWIHTRYRLRAYPLAGITSQVLFVIVFVAGVKFFF